MEKRVKDIRVEFVRVEGENKNVSFYSRTHLERNFRWMGCKVNTANQMTRMFFSILSSASKVIIPVVKKRFIVKEKKPEADEGDEDEGEESEEEEVLPDEKSYCSSSTDTTTAFFTRKFTYDSRFLSLQEFGLVTKKVRNEKLNAFLIKSMSKIVAKQYLIKYRTNEEYSRKLLDFKGIFWLFEDDFLSIIKVCLVAFNYNRIHRIEYFRQSCLFFSRSWFMIILLSGTSGTGKSTLGSLLCSRMGINKFISTDSIRHCLREDTSLSKRDRDILFCSSYTVGDLEYFSQIRNPRKRAIEGYKAHCDLLYKHLRNLILLFIRKKESVIIEGVHLNVPLIVKLVRKFRGENVFPYLVYVKSEEKHMKRFGVRSKSMTLDPEKNKYIRYIRKIRTIQNHLVRQSHLFKIPKIDNVLIDRSIAFLHFSVLKTIDSCVFHEGNVWNEEEKRFLNTDPNKFTEEVRTKRMVKVLKKKRLMMEAKKNFPDFEFDERRKKKKPRHKKKRKRVFDPNQSLRQRGKVMGKLLGKLKAKEEKKKRRKKDKLEKIGALVKGKKRSYHSDGEVERLENRSRDEKKVDVVASATPVVGKEEEREKMNTLKKKIKEEMKIENLLRRKDAQFVHAFEASSESDEDADKVATKSGDEASEEEEEDEKSPKKVRQQNSKQKKSQTGEEAVEEEDEGEEEEGEEVPPRPKPQQPPQPKEETKKKKKKKKIKREILVTKNSMVSFHSSSSESDEDELGGGEAKRRKMEEEKYVSTYGIPTSSSSDDDDDEEDDDAEEEEKEVGRGKNEGVQTTEISMKEEEEYEGIVSFAKEKQRTNKEKEGKARKILKEEVRREKKKKKKKKKKRIEANVKGVRVVVLGGISSSQDKKKEKTKKKGKKEVTKVVVGERGSISDSELF